MTDNVGGRATRAFTATVDNLRPVLVVADVAGNEGSAVGLIATFTDAGIQDTHSATIFWNDGTSTAGSVTEAGGQGTITAQHTFADDGLYPVRIDLLDDDGGAGSETVFAAIANVPPTVSPAANQTVTEGIALNLTVATFTDPGFTNLVAGTSETFNATINWGDGTSEPAALLVTPGSSGTPTLGSVLGQHIYTDDGTFTVTVAVTDDDGGLGTASFQVIVQAAVTEFLSINSPAGREGEEVTLQASFRDVGVLDTHTAIVEWGDNSTSVAEIGEHGGLERYVRRIP